MGNGSMLEGVLEGIDQGWFQRRIAESAFEEQRRYESGDLVKVGVTDFVDTSESPIETLVIGEEAERTQLERVRRTRATRDAGAADDALITLKEAATTDVNLMEPLIDCARARCTEGEIVGALSSVFGTYRETPAF
jgi:methylmalonyl-CoA mutase N-terminal domain/subunit